MRKFLKNLKNIVLRGDCLQVMNYIPDKSVDMVLCDLPYGTTDCKWDSIIPFEPLWEAWKRICKPKAAIVLTAREPFTSVAVMSNIKCYRHKWVWNKKQAGAYHLAKYMPLQIEEDILVFGLNSPNYYPQMREGVYRKRGNAKKILGIKTGNGFHPGFTNYSNLYFPVNIIEMANPRLNKLHPTQKPVALFEYLIRTYSKEGELILDNCAGSGTTAIACLNSKRNYIIIEKEPENIEIPCRIKENLS